MDNSEDSAKMILKRMTRQYEAICPICRRMNDDLREIELRGVGYNNVRFLIHIVRRREKKKGYRLCTLKTTKTTSTKR